MAITQQDPVIKYQVKVTSGDNQREPLFTRAQSHVHSLCKVTGSKAQDKQGHWDLVQTPTHINNLCGYLENYINKPDAHILREGFTKGFRLNYPGSRLSSGSKDPMSAIENKDLEKTHKTK